MEFTRELTIMKIDPTSKGTGGVIRAIDERGGKYTSLYLTSNEQTAFTLFMGGRAALPIEHFLKFKFSVKDGEVKRINGKPEGGVPRFLKRDYMNNVFSRIVIYDGENMELRAIQELYQMFNGVTIYMLHRGIKRNSNCDIGKSETIADYFDAIVDNAKIRFRILNRRKAVSVEDFRTQEFKIPTSINDCKYYDEYENRKVLGMYDAISEAEAYIAESIESLHHDEVSEKKIFEPFSKGFTPVLTNDHRIMTLLNEYGHGKYLKIYSDVQKLVVPVRRGEPVAIIDRYPTKVWYRQLPIGTIGRIGDMKHISLLDYDPALTLAMHYNCPQGDCYHIYRDVQTKLGLGGRNADYKNPNIFCWRNPMMDVSIESLLKSSNYDPINR